MIYLRHRTVSQPPPANQFRSSAAKFLLAASGLMLVTACLAVHACSGSRKGDTVAVRTTALGDRSLHPSGTAPLAGNGAIPHSAGIFRGWELTLRGIAPVEWENAKVRRLGSMDGGEADVYLAPDGSGQWLVKVADSARPGFGWFRVVETVASPSESAKN